jgi:hypothetical protein
VHTIRRIIDFASQVSSARRVVIFRNHCSTASFGGVSNASRRGPFRGASEAGRYFCWGGFERVLRLRGASPRRTLHALHQAKAPSSVSPGRRIQGARQRRAAKRPVEMSHPITRCARAWCTDRRARTRIAGEKSRAHCTCERSMDPFTRQVGRRGVCPSRITYPMRAVPGHCTSRGLV